jgi:hypothetical protein
MVTNSGDSSSSSGSIPIRSHDTNPSLVITIDTPNRRKKDTNAKEELLSEDVVVSVEEDSFSPNDESTPLKCNGNKYSNSQLESSNRTKLHLTISQDEDAFMSPIDVNGAGLSPHNGMTSSLMIPNGKNGNSLDVPAKDVESICTAHSDLMAIGPINDKTGCAASGSPCFWKHPKVRENWRVFLTAFGLLVVGSALIVLGVLASVFPEFGFQSYVFLISGLLCFIPGAYHVVYVYCAVSGRKGYDLYRLPYYN